MAKIRIQAYQTTDGFAGNRTESQVAESGAKVLSYLAKISIDGTSWYDVRRPTVGRASASTTNIWQSKPKMIERAKRDAARLLSLRT